MSFFGQSVSHVGLSGTDSQSSFKSLPNDLILDMTKLKAFADDRLKVDKMTISLSDGVENT